MPELKTPKTESYYNILLNGWIFTSLISLVVSAVSFRFLENMDGIQASFTGAILIISFFIFIVGLFIHTEYDILREEDMWQVEELRQNNPDIASYLLKVGKMNRKLVRCELRDLFEYDIECRRIEREKMIYGQEIK